MCEKYIQDGKMAVLVSVGFGAGWSTQAWNSKKELYYDKRVVEYWLKHKDDKDFLDLDSFNDNPIKENAQKLFESWGYNDVYFGGFEDIVLRWVPIGTKFIVDEYDGAEAIQTIDDFKWIIA